MSARNPDTPRTAYSHHDEIADQLEDMNILEFELRVKRYVTPEN